MAGYSGFQYPIVIGVGCDGPPQEIQAMQPSLGTNGVYSIVDVFLSETKLLTITLQNGFILQHHRNRHIGSPTTITQ